MRIKMRFWDTENKVMVDWLAVMQTAFNCDSEDTGLLYRLMSNARYEKLQFTGLKDKNGKEIYEGDLIRWDKDGVQEVMHTLAWDGKFENFYAPFMSAWGSTCGKHFRTFMNIYDPTRFAEVIGNKYEQHNQELTA